MTRKKKKKTFSRQRVRRTVEPQKTVTEGRR